MPKPNAKIAIITRTKDRPVLLPRAIKSVLGQSYDNWLHVVINDGGDKKIVEDILSSHKEKYKNRLHVLHNKTSLGMETAANKAIDACESAYVVIHDDDDGWHKDFLKKMLATIETSEIPNVAGAVCHSVKIVEQIKGKKTKEISRSSFNQMVNDIGLWRICGGNLFPPISFLYKRAVFDKIGGMYNEELPVMGDWEFNIRFCQHYEIAVLPEELAYYYHRESAQSKGDVYANSIVGGANKHDSYYNYLRNTLLRKDLEQGKVGVGHLVNLSYDLRTASEKQDQYRIEEMGSIEEGKKLIHEVYHSSNLQHKETLDNLASNHYATSAELQDQGGRIRGLYAIFKPLIWLAIKLKLIRN